MTTIPARLTTIPMTPPEPAHVGHLEPSPEPLGNALARLEARWGSAAVRLGNGGRIDAPTAITRAGAIGSRASGTRTGPRRPPP
jgi:hypothetical protein